MEKIIENYSRKYEEGFTAEEIYGLLTKLSVDRIKFWEAIGEVTGIIIDGDFVYYTSDVELGVRCALENRNPTTNEFD